MSPPGLFSNFPLTRGPIVSLAPHSASNHTMASTTRLGRITGPVSYLAGEGGYCTIPLGPCLVERGAGPLVGIIWGASCQNSVALPVTVMARAEQSGYLVLLD